MRTDSGKESYVGWWVDGRWLFGGIEHATRWCFIVPTDHRGTVIFIPLYKKYILFSMTIYSDSWKAKHELGNFVFSYKVVNHPEHLVDSTTGKTLSLGCWEQVMKFNITTIFCLVHLLLQPLWVWYCSSSLPSGDSTLLPSTAIGKSVKVHVLHVTQEGEVKGGNPLL